MKKLIFIIMAFILLAGNAWATVVIAETNTTQESLITATHSFAGYASNYDGSGVTNYYKTNDGSYVIINTNTSSWTLDYDTTAIADGTNVWTFRTISADQSETNTYAQTNVVDNSVPVCGLTNVSNESYIDGNFTFMGTNWEDYSSNTDVAFFISNNSDVVWTNVGTISGDWIYYATNTANFDDGIYYIYASITNELGTNNQSTPIQMFFINSEPLIACTNFTYLSTNSGTNYWAGYASNVFPTIDPVAVYLQTNSGSLGSITTAANGWTTNFNSQTLADGTNIWTVYGVTSNSLTNSYSWTNIIDNFNPALGITNLTNDQELSGTAYTLRGTNYELWPALTTTRVIISNHYGVVITNAEVSVSSHAWNWTWFFDPYPGGTYYMYMTTTNDLGSNYTTSVISFSLEFSAPNPVSVGAFPVSMGSTRDDNEEPVHSVFVSAFEMADSEITYEQWIGVLDWATNNGYSFENEGQMGGERFWDLEDHTNLEPVVNVSYYDAIKYCNALSEMQNLTPCYYTNYIDSGNVYRTGTETVYNSNVLFTNTATSTNGWRLPTEAEWEQAYYYAGASTYFWGNGDGGNYMWYRRNASLTTHPVKTKLSNDYALFDMSGNVWEWVHDWYGSYTNVPQYDPRGPTSGTYRTVRGGSFKDSHANNTGTRRFYFLPQDNRYFLGFRTCKTQ